MSDYAYLNARVCSMRTDLLPRALIEELMSFKSVRTIAERLLDTAYRTGLAASLGQQKPLQALDASLDAYLQSRAQRIVELADEDARRWVQTFVDDWDVQAIKTILRGLRRGLAAEAILEAVGPAARLTRRDLTDLAEQPDARGVMDLLLSWSSPWGAALKRQWSEYVAADDPDVLEYALDVQRFETAYGLDCAWWQRDDVAVQLMAAEAELTNVVQCLLTMGRSRPPRLVPVPGRPSRTVRALTGVKNLADAAGILADSPFRDVLDIALPFMTHAGHLGMFERLLQHERLVQSRRMAVRDPLSIAVPGHYLRCKRNEVINIKLVARGVANGLPVSAIQASLVFAPES